MGIIGNEGGRKDIVILGEAVERAFLYMQAAMRIFGRVFVDLNTRRDSSPFIDYAYCEHVEFVNKTINYPLFEPLNPFAQSQSLQTCKMSISLDPSYIESEIISSIRLHSNPFDFDFTNSYQSTFTHIYGMENGDVLH